MVTEVTDSKDDMPEEKVSTQDIIVETKDDKSDLKDDKTLPTEANPEGSDKNSKDTKSEIEDPPTKPNK